MNSPIYRDAFGMQYRLNYSAFERCWYIQRTFGPNKFSNYLKLRARSPEEAEWAFKHFIENRETDIAFH